MQTTIYRKETDRGSFLHSKSEYPISLKKSIQFSQALRLKRISTTLYPVLKMFLEGGYKHTDIKENIEKANNFSRKNQPKETHQNKGSRVPLTISYNREAANISK